MPFSFWSWLGGHNGSAQTGPVLPGNPLARSKPYVPAAENVPTTNETIFAEFRIRSLWERRLSKFQFAAGLPDNRVQARIAVWPRIPSLLRSARRFRAL